MRKISAVVTIMGTVILLMLMGCYNSNAKSYEPKQIDKISAWAVYWDVDATLAEIALLQDNLESLHYFAAYFDNDAQLFVPEQTTQLFQEVQTLYPEHSWDSYLTIVNDQLLSNGNSLLKDTTLLYTLLADDASIANHIEAIIDFAQAGGYDGIEIDYETINKDFALWNSFLKFCQLLFERTTQEDLKLRILLEPGAPLADLNFPVGPEYVMMCYFLHGPNGEPGPLADYAFLEQLVARMQLLPSGEKSFALTTGGFDWLGNISQELNEQEALALLASTQSVPSRDSTSGVLTFQYQGIDGMHEVWYTDGATINNWMQTILQDDNYGITIWKLGKNNDPASWFKIPDSKL